jgi:hypothetical protein
MAVFFFLRSCLVSRLIIESRAPSLCWVQATLETCSEYRCIRLHLALCAVLTTPSPMSLSYTFATLPS